MWWVGERWKLDLFRCQGGSSRVSLGEGKDVGELNLGKMEHLTATVNLAVGADLEPV